MLLQEDHGHGEEEEEELEAGALEDLDGSPYNLGGTQLTDGAVTPDGRFLYFGDQTGAVLAFSVDGARGFLQGLPTLTTGLAVSRLAMDPAGAFLVALDATNNRLAVFRVNSGGILTDAGTTNLAAPPQQALVSGTRLLVTVNNQLLSFTLDRTSGALTQVGQANLVAGNYPGLALQGDLVVVADQAGNTLSSFRLAPDGTLTALVNQALPAGQLAPTALLLEGTQLVTANRDSNNLSVVTVDLQTGGFTFGDPVDSQGQGPVDLRLIAEGRALLVANSGSNQIATFEVDEGELEPGEGSPYDADGGPSRLLFLERVESIVVTVPIQTD